MSPEGTTPGSDRQVRRGTLRVYLGAAPGVGKSFAMLAEGHRRHLRGTDVVVAAIDPHGRGQTEALLSGLETVPGRGPCGVLEMDLEAVLRRAPRVALVDELAHPSAPGSPWSRRWQEVEELLAAGIDVISTVGVEQLESLRDPVVSITGAEPRDTVPDLVVRRADQIELVDMSPEALRRRMAHGNIYDADRVDAALANYFRPGNLAALREMALLWLADRVEEGLLDYRRDHATDAQWETRERILVALTAAPGADAVIRRAARMAMRARGQLVGVHVRMGERASAGSAEALRRHRDLLEELGGTYREVAGPDVARALAQVAKSESATQVVLGATRQGKLADLVRGSVVNRVVRSSGAGVDVHVVPHAGPSPSPRPGAGWMRRATLSWRRQAAALALAGLALPLLTVLLTNVRQQVGFSGALPSYLLVVVAVATAGGLWPAVPTVASAFLLLNWFFVPPLHTFTIADVQSVSALAAYVVVASVVSALVALAAQRATEASRARSAAEALANMAGALLRGDGDLSKLVGTLATTFPTEGVAILTYEPGAWRAQATAGPRPPTCPAEGTLDLPLATGQRLVVKASELTAEDQRVLQTFAAQLALALESRRLAAEAANAAALAKANELRAGLLAAISHDLRSPLAAIKASATSLLSDDVAWEPAATRELLATIDDEADRLNALVANLLDMSRLRAQAVVVRRQSVALEEVVLMALAGLPTEGRKVQVEISETLPQVEADPALLERVVANLIDNALRFSPEVAPLRVEAGAVAARVHLRVVDRGSGVPAADRARIFQPFQRLGDSPQGAGVGLGLAVARGFSEAMGADLMVEDTPGGGTTMVVSLPAVTR
jgi:two-component system sensor histidine kinase KdpD